MFASTYLQVLSVYGGSVSSTGDQFRLRGISFVYGGSVCKQLRNTAKYDVVPTSGDNLCRGRPANLPGLVRPPGTVRSGPARPGPARPGPARPGPARHGPARPGPARPGRPPCPVRRVWKDWLDYGGSDQLCMSINDDVRIFAYFFQVCRRIGDIPDL